MLSSVQESSGLLRSQSMHPTRPKPFASTSRPKPSPLNLKPAPLPEPSDKPDAASTGSRVVQLVRRVAKRPSKGPVSRKFLQAQQDSDGRMVSPGPASRRSVSDPAHYPALPKSAPAHVTRFTFDEEDPTQARRRSFPPQAQAPPPSPTSAGFHYPPPPPVDRYSVESPTHTSPALGRKAPPPSPLSDLVFDIHSAGPSYSHESPPYIDFPLPTPPAAYRPQATARPVARAAPAPAPPPKPQDPGSELLLLEDVFSLLHSSDSYGASTVLGLGLTLSESVLSWDAVPSDLGLFMASTSEPLIVAASSSDALGAVKSRREAGRARSYTSVPGTPSIVVTAAGEEGDNESIIEHSELQHVLDMFPVPPAAVLS